uniref:Uncharacterized protein n=1 Tax=Oryza sativa subsp. japonica TaxID=39947 RepID=Q5Z5D4_ORYSJ|nr:hypothetical protein [Oryza sativa Japonica Group]BAD62089.1 hypothetical protein [Oryza sativa Japonica Group]
MSTLLSLLSFILVMVVGVGEGRKLLSAKKMTMMVPDRTADVMAYWKTVHPNSPIPSAILNLLTQPSGGWE